MESRNFARKVALVTIFAVSPVANADYAVQIGAYEKPSLLDSTAAEEVAQVRTRESASGVTRILVGRFSSNADARAALAALKAAGYSDAFIIRTSDDAMADADSAAPSRRSASAVSQRQWSHLSADLRAKLVLLDGRPHVKDGATFTPLEKYPQQ